MTLFDLCRKYDCVKTRDKHLYAHAMVRDIYPMYLDSRRFEELKILEIGVFKGGFTRALKEYCPNSTIIGVDVDEYSETEGLNVKYGTQSDRKFMKKICKDYGPFDIVIDDGGHRWQDQLISQEVIWGRMCTGGLYFIEDLIPRFSGHILFNHIRNTFLSVEEFVELKRSNFRFVSFHPSMIVMGKLLE